MTDLLASRRPVRCPFDGDRCAGGGSGGGVRNVVLAVGENRFSYRVHGFRRFSTVFPRTPHARITPYFTISLQSSTHTHTAGKKTIFLKPYTRTSVSSLLVYTRAHTHKHTHTRLMLSFPLHFTYKCATQIKCITVFFANFKVRIPHSVFYRLLSFF